jgi:methyl-accepting chemotaxis protein
MNKIFTNKYNFKFIIGIVMVIVLLAAFTWAIFALLNGFQSGKNTIEQVQIMSLILGIVLFSLGIFMGTLNLFHISKIEKDLQQALKDLAIGKAPKVDRKKIETARGNYAMVGGSILDTFNYYQEKIHWYISILDAIPFPLSVTDNDMNWTFVNKPVEQFLKVKRETVMGHQCSEWGANICKTENCGIARLRNNFLVTFFEQSGGNFKVDTSYLTDRKGERIGHVEVVSDVTSLSASKKYQEHAVNDLAGCLEMMASGDLSFDIPELQEADSNTVEVRENFIQIHDSLTRARDTLSNAISIVVENAESVADASNHLKVAAGQSGTATSQIATTMQQIASGSAQQNESVNKTANTMEMMDRIVDGMNAGVQNQDIAVQQVGKISVRISGEDGISEKVTVSANQVQEMGARSNEISAIVETIEDIASQTNLLALNAAIEAARAGEHGKGFAVVADEVRKLAERSNISAKEIHELVKGIQESVSQAIDLSNLAAEDMKVAADDLDMAIQSVATVVKENNAAANQMSNSSQEVLQSIENIASITEENSASVEEVSASAEEMTAQVQEVSASAEKMAEMAASLREAVSHFNLTKVQE